MQDRVNLPISTDLTPKTTVKDTNDDQGRRIGLQKSKVTEQDAGIEERSGAPRSERTEAKRRRTLVRDLADTSPQVFPPSFVVVNLFPFPLFFPKFPGLTFGRLQYQAETLLRNGRKYKLSRA